MPTPPPPTGFPTRWSPRYAIRLAPDLEAATFTGDVRIEADGPTEIDTITLHGAELGVTSADIVSQGTANRPRRGDEEAEQIVLSLPPRWGRDHHHRRRPSPGS